MSLGKRLLEARKRKQMSQAELAKIVGTKGPAIGRYERDVSQPSLETIIKIATVLEVSVDYLLGIIEDELDPKNANRLVAIQKLPKDIQSKIFYFLDMSIRDATTQKAYS